MTGVSADFSNRIDLLLGVNMIGPERRRRNDLDRSVVANILLPHTRLVDDG